MTSPGRDLRLALRALRARPTLSIVRVTTLAVVVAAASAVLLVVNATLVRPLPFRDPDRLVRIYMQPPGTSSFDQANPQTRPLVLLLAAVAALSLIAIANLANLTLADILHRRSELAVRSALGASRCRLLWPEIVQSLIIATAGGGAGLLAAQAMVPALVALDPASALTSDALALDWRVAGVVALLAFVVINAAAVLPAFRVAGRDVAAAMAEGARRTIGGPGHERLRAWLVATQTALALVLVSSGALLASAFAHTARTHPGFDPEHVLTAQLRLAETAYASAEVRTAFVDSVLARVRAIPGVVDASTTMNVFVPGFTFQTLVHIDGRPTATGEPHTVLFRRISPGYFRTLQIPEQAGRTFDGRDTAAGMPVAVVSQSFAQRFWPGEDVMGKRLRRNGVNAPWLTIIGIVGDVHDVGYGKAPDAILYICVGLLLAAIGIYAVTARSVAERTREIGVRIALGGQPHRVWWAVARRTLGAFAAGLGAGCAGAAAAASLLAWIFPEVQAASPLAAAPAFVLLVLAGGGTTLAAAFRATRVDPLRALR